MFCPNFINETACYWTFSTLAQVFGAILGLLSIFVIFAIKRFDELRERIGRDIDRWENGPKKIVASDGREWPREKMTKSLYNEHMSLGETKSEYIKRFIFTITLITCVIGYSIVFLPFSFLFAKHIVFFLFCSIIIPIFVLFVIICFISISFIYQMPPHTFKMGYEPLFKWWEFWKCGCKYYKRLF